MDNLQETENKLLLKKVKLKTRVFGNKTSQWAVSINNLIPIEKDTVGTVVDVDEEQDTKTIFITIKFNNVLFANVGISTVDLI